MRRRDWLSPVVSRPSSGSGRSSDPALRTLSAKRCKRWTRQESAAEKIQVMRNAAIREMLNPMRMRFVSGPPLLKSTSTIMPAISTKQMMKSRTRIGAPMDQKLTTLHSKCDGKV